jgi:hypothetical protein
MSAFAGPQPVPSGLVFAVDASSPKSYSQNVIQNSTDLYALFGSYGVNTGSTIRDTSVTDSPVGGVPLKLTSTGTDAYIASYSSMASNLAAAATGQTWTVSFYAKASAATTSLCYLFGANSSGGYIELTSASHSITTTWQRFSFSLTMSNALTAFVQFRFGCSVNGGVIWFDGLQLERASSASAFQSLPNVSGTSWNDISGRYSAATLSNFPTYLTANNGSILFNGTSHSASVAAGAGSMGTGNWTISCWWKSNGAQSNYVALISQGFTGSPSNGSWAFKVSHTSGDFNFTYCTPTISDNLSSNNPNDDAWHHLVAIRNGTSLILYKDGASVKSITLPAGQTFGTGATTYIGYNPRDNTYLKGYLANLAIYNVAWTADQLAASYNAQRGRVGV